MYETLKRLRGGLVNVGEAQAIVRSVLTLQHQTPTGTVIGVVAFGTHQAALIRCALQLSQATESHHGSDDVAVAVDVRAADDVIGLGCDVVLVGMTQPYPTKLTGEKGFSRSAALHKLCHICTWCGRWQCLVYVSGGQGQGGGGRGVGRLSASFSKLLAQSYLSYRRRFQTASNTQHGSGSRRPQSKSKRGKGADEDLVSEPTGQSLYIVDRMTTRSHAHTRGRAHTHTRVRLCPNS